MPGAAVAVIQGLGWMSGEYRGLQVISHTGGTTGFSARIAFLPDADLGVAIPCNASSLPGALAFTFAVQFHPFELLFDRPAEIDAELSALVQARAMARPQLAPGVDPAYVAPYLPPGGEHPQQRGNPGAATSRQ